MKNKEGVALINVNPTYHLTREELSKKNATDFCEGDLIICGKYSILISYTDPTGFHKEPMPVSFYTTVKRGGSQIALKKCDIPQYIQSFINCYNHPI